MARVATPLTDTKCEAAKPRDKDYKLFDGKGLYLLVKPTGVKSWRLKFKKPDGRDGLTAFGNYPALGLKAARERRAAALELLAQGIDPIEHARQAKAEASDAASNTFKAVALEWHAAGSRKWSAGHAANILRRLEVHLFPLLGERIIVDLKTRDLIAPLKKLEANDLLDVAGRLRQHIAGIMRLAVQRGIIDTNPANDLQGVTATRKAQHRPALPLHCLPDFLQRLEAHKGRKLTQLAVELTLLTFIRSSELRFARWSEIDFDRALWTIPGERQPIEGVRYSSRGAKMRTTHLVPLSHQALACLAEVQELTGGYDLIFVGDHYHWRPMSENTVNAALRRLGYDTATEVCGHGFRAMACSALVESGLFTHDAVERQMSHQERNGVRAAYIHKAEHMDERRIMCQWWADYLDACRKTYIPPFDFANKKTA